MNTQFQGSNAGAPAGNEDATAKAGNGSGSGEGQPSAPEKADPPAAGEDTTTGNQTAPDMGELTRKAIEGSDTLQKLAGKKTDDKKGDQPAAKQGDKPAKPNEKPAAGAPAAGNKQEAPKPAAYEPQDPKAKEAFAKLRTDLKARDQEIAQLRKSTVTDEVRESAAFGQQISKALESVRDDFEVVTDEQLADVVSVRGAINRMSHAIENGQKPYSTDMRTFEAAYRSLHDLAVQLGVADEGAGGDSMPEPLTGELPARWAKLVEYGDLSEKEARLHAAVEAAAGGRTRQPSRTRQPERQPEKREERAPEAKALPQRSQQQERKSSQQEDSPEDTLYKGRTRQFLIDAKVAASPKEAADHWKTHLLPIIIRELIAPAVGEDAVDHFLSLKPETRYSLAKEAQQLHAERTKPKDDQPEGGERPKGEKPKAPLFQRNFTTSRSGPPSAADDRKEHSNKVLGFLAGKSAES
jgi:hypothetical protein